MVTGAFAAFLQSVLPGADPAKARQCIKTLTNNPPDSRELYSLVLPDPVYQGDIVEPVDFLVPANGEYAIRSNAGMLLSHSCDMKNDEEVIMAECFPLAEFTENDAFRASIQSNKLYNLMFLRAVPRKGDLVVNLTRVQTVSTSMINERLGAGDLVRVSSFTDLGYYFFAAKLTVHLLRVREEDEVRAEAPSLTFLQRSGIAWRILWGKS
jgi:hypothetical protein